MKVGDWDWYKVCNLIVQAFASIATVALAYIAYCELETAKVARQEVDALQKEALIQKATLSNALDRVNLYGGMLAAGGGNRFAYKRAQECLWSRIRSGDKEAESLSLQLGNGMRHFLGGTNENQVLQNILFGPIFNDQAARIDALLKHKDFTQRLRALKCISWLRLNSYIPAVVESLEKEPDLNVVQFAVQIINETFNDNLIFNDPTPRYALSVDDCVFRYADFRKHFYEMWDAAKARILARKPKELRERPDPQRGGLQDIFDPENPNEHKP